MEDRCGKAGEIIRVKSAVLTGYKLCFAGKSKSWDYAGVATIVEDENSIVHGAIYDVNDRQLEILDEKEGAPSYYKRKYVHIDGQELLTYVKVKNDFYPPGNRYLNRISEGYTDWGLPIELLAGIKTND